MSSLEKRQENRRGSTHGPRKCSDGIIDASIAGSFMDETDREVSSLTDRAFRSLCIGEDAIYNDLEVSSPVDDQRKVCAQEAAENKALRTAFQESSRGIQYVEAERTSEVASTFQHSYVDLAQEHVLKDGNLSYISNGSTEVRVQQKRSGSRVRSGEVTGYCDSGAPGTERDKYQDFYNESWDKSALLSIQRELSEFSSGYHPNMKPGSIQSYGNNFHQVGRMNIATSSKAKFKALSTSNFFFHSEFSPFQLWKDYNRFPFEMGEPSGFLSATEFPTWYDSPLYKELTATHQISCTHAEGRQVNQTQTEDVACSQGSRSTVMQKASAVEKRCESEMASHCPPWKSNNSARNKLPSNRPSTVSPTNEKVHRPDSSLLYRNRHTYEIQQNVGKVGNSEISTRTTPFNITQLLTPVIPGRQETETSEIMQFAHSPSVSDCDSDLKPQSDAKLLRDSYKSKASSLLFNLKDNRKRVKSTYSPTKFKSSEISDRNKQPSKLEGRESRLSQESLSQYGSTDYNIPYLGSQNSHTDQLTIRENEHYELSTNVGLDDSGGSPVGHFNDSTRTFGQTRPETDNIFSNAHLSHLREDAGHQRKASCRYIDNHVTDENISWKIAGPANSLTKDNGGKDVLPYKGEIAALIEMDKQRKAIAKQYLPSANESYTVRKETYINKENENVNGNWPKSSFHTNKHLSNKQVKDFHTHTPTTYHDAYEFQQNGLANMASPPKRGSDQITTPEKAEVCLQRHTKHATRDVEADCHQRTQFLQTTDEKYRYNEGSVAYQPYKYESNKQWHIATTENRHTYDEEFVSRQLQQSELKPRQPGESNYVRSLSRASCVQQQSTECSPRTSQRNVISEDRIKTEGSKPTYSITPNQIYNKRGDINIANSQRTLQNCISSQTRGDRFNINDILSVRDHEQAKRVREMKHSFNWRTGDQTKLENLSYPVTEDIVAKPDPSKLQSHAQQDGISHSRYENTNVSYVRKESHIPNDVKERSRKDIFVNNENDKITIRALSYKEKGQTKQEILTSKLKAHAQKEISAIKGKGLAKHAIPLRTPIKQSTAISNDKGLINQDVLSPKKEITAEKLNHLFQDVTYSSVPLYKEQRNQDMDEPKHESLTAEKDMSSEKDNVTTEKERTNIHPQEEKVTETDKENDRVQSIVPNNVHQPYLQPKDNEIERPTNDTAVTHGTVLAKYFASPPHLKLFSDEESAVKNESKTSSTLPTTCTASSTEALKCQSNDSCPKHEVLAKVATNNLTLYNISGEILERSVNNAKDQLSNVNADKPTASSNTASVKCSDLPEPNEYKNNTRKENALKPANASQHEISTRQDKTPSYWRKDEVPGVEATVECTDTKTASPNKNIEMEHLQSGAGGISKSQTVLSKSSPKAISEVDSKPNTDAPENETCLEEQKMQKETKTNEFKQLQNNSVKISEHAHAVNEIGYQTILSLSKADSSEENISVQQELKIQKEHGENGEVQEMMPQSTLKIKNQNWETIKDKNEATNSNQQQDSEDASDADSHKHIEITCLEKNQSNEYIRAYNSNGSKFPGADHEESAEKLLMPIITITDTDQQLDKTADSTKPVTENHVIHISSNEDSSPTDEPVIYSISVSSTSEAISEDEPVIYSISVSSMSEASMKTVPENQERRDKQLSVEQAENDKKEIFSNKNKESDCLESKEDSEEVQLLLNNHVAEQETVERKYGSPAGKDKPGYYRSTELDNISSSYESLLAKYGLPNGDTICLESDRKEPDKKEESLEKTENKSLHGVHVPVEEMLTWPDSPQSRNTPKASMELLRIAEESDEQRVTQSEQEHQTATGGGTQRADGAVYSDRTTKQEELLMSKVVPVTDNTVDVQSAMHIVANRNVQLKESKQVRQNVQTMERVLKDYDDVVNKETQMVQVKDENDRQPTAGFHSASTSITSLNHSYDDSPHPSSKLSTNNCQIRIKTQDTAVESSVKNNQNALSQTGNTKSPILQYRTQEEYYRQENLSRDHLQTVTYKALQNNRKDLISKSEYPEIEQVKCNADNEVKVSMVINSQKEISTFTDLQSRENDNANQNQIKSALPAGKTRQSIFTMSDILLKDKEMHRNDIENPIKTYTVSTRGGVPPNNVIENAQNTPGKAEGAKASSAPVMADFNIEKINEEWKREPEPKERESKKHEIIPLNKNPNISSNAECDFSKRDRIRISAKSQAQDKRSDHFEKLIIDNTRNNTEQREMRAETRKEMSDITRWDIESSGKVLGDKAQKDGLPERQGHAHDIKKSSQNSQYHDTVRPINEETKAEVIQREKKMTRPEISALADYARLRVISADDDTNTEKDLLKNINTYHKYNLSQKPQKAHFSMSVGDTEQSKVNQTSEHLNATPTHVKVPELQTYKMTDQCSPMDEIITYPKSSDYRVLMAKGTERAKENNNHVQSIKSLASSRHEVYQARNPRDTQPIHTQTDSINDPRLKQPVSSNILERNVYPHVKNSQSVPPPTQMSVDTEFNNADIHADNQVMEEVKDEEAIEELQYYIVNALESERKPKNDHEPPTLCYRITSKKDLSEIQATTPRSNSSSPAVGKPIMFRVKDNTCKASSVTKTVRPRFHRSFSEEFRIGSPVDICCSSDKDKAEYERVHDPKESATSPVLHEQSVTSRQHTRGKEIAARNRMLSPAFIAPKEPRSYNRRRHTMDGDESQSLITRVSEDMDSVASSSAVTIDGRGFDAERMRHTYARPESSCYERPESACYERPDSVCSDMRPASKPPSVPPKTEKGLRRAQKLTSRRIRKVEVLMTSDTPVQSETKSIRTVSSLPASPMVQTSAPQSVQVSPPISHYCVEPNHAPHAPRIVAHTFPMTQRKLLQDPNSGQIFMVDVPVQVKTKTFIDPETGKYLQFNVHQRAQNTLSQPASVEMLGHSYVVYPGFLPMPVSVSSLPTVRSSSQMSAPATLKASHEPSEKKKKEPECDRNVRQHNRPAYRTSEPAGREILQSDNVRMTPRQTHIITMSELEDFAMEHT